jgi:hypothetical protein
VTLEEFRASLAKPRPPAGLGKPLEALWHAGRGDWERAHRIAMSAKSRDAAWVHALLHRQEGDLDNARYWYRQAKRPEHGGTLDEEWAAIAADLLARG